MSEVMGEIAAASEQQSEGVSQVTQAVGEMEGVTQQNAATAEESASAAEELSSQAEEMQSMVAGFQLTQSLERRIAGARPVKAAWSPPQTRPVTTKVSGKPGANGHGPARTVRPGAGAALAAAPAGHTYGHANGRSAAGPVPETLIPFDDDALSGF